VGADGPAPPPPGVEPARDSQSEPNAEPNVGSNLRDELVAAPPFLTWRAIYAIVLGALAVEIALFAALTAAVR
jgi:hypothetical protein